MIKDIRLLILATIPLLFNVGCSLTTLENPLVNPDAAKPVPKIYGEFQKKGTKDGALARLRIEPATDEFPKGFLFISDLEKPKQQKLVSFLEPVGEYFILHTMINKDKKKHKPFISDQQKWNEDDILGYLIIGLKIDDKSIQAAMIDQKFIQKEFEEKRIKGRVESTGDDSKSKSIVITESTPELKKYFAKHIEKGLFKEPTDVWIRVE